MTFVTYLIILLNINKIFCIWPPPYKINLSQEETFVIFDPIESSELQDVYEYDEMISKDDMKSLNVESHNDKFYRIHRNLGDNKKLPKYESNPVVKKSKVFEEFNPNLEYSAPFQAGLVNEKQEFVNDDVINFDELDETKISNREVKTMKRDQTSNATEENYDYNGLKEQFDVELEKAAHSNKTVNYTNVEEDESLKDSFKKILSVKEDKNCTEEERKGIGLGAVECFWIDLNKPKLRSRVLEGIIRMVVIWIIIYLIIATPLWCQYGWCCCCCRCKFCQPREQIDEIKQFYAQNPPGTFHDEDGNVIQYQPTRYEKYAQKALENELRKL